MSFYIGKPIEMLRFVAWAAFLFTEIMIYFWTTPAHAPITDRENIEVR